MTDIREALGERGWPFMAAPGTVLATLHFRDGRRIVLRPDAILIDRVKEMVG